MQIGRQVGGRSRLNSGNRSVDYTLGGKWLPTGPQKRRILKSESALQPIAFARRAVAGRIRFSESAAFAARSVLLRT